MSTVRVGVEMFEGGVRAVAAERKRDGWHVHWNGTLRGEPSAAEQGQALAARLEERNVLPDELYLALPVTPGTVFSALELPPLSPSELIPVAEAELRRETDRESGAELAVAAWQYARKSGAGANTLAAALPRSVVDNGLSLAQATGIPLRFLTVSVATLHQALLAAGEMPEAGATGLVHLAERFGVAAYVRGRRWISTQVFSLPGAGETPEADLVVREIKRSFMAFRSQASGMDLDTLLLTGPQMPEEDLALTLREELPEVRVELFNLREALRLEGLELAGEFLRRQIEYAVPLLLATRGEQVRLDFRPPSLRIPEIKSNLIYRLGVAAAAAVLLLALHWGWVRFDTGEVEEGAAEARRELARIEPKLAALRDAEALKEQLGLYRGALGLSRQQLGLTGAALRETSLAVSERVGLESLVVRQGSEGLHLSLDGTSYGDSPSAARTGLDQFLFELRRSPVFTEVEVSRHDLDGEGGVGGSFRVQFGIRTAITGTVTGIGRDGS